MSDRFLQGVVEDFIRGVSSPITTVGGSSYTPATTFLTVAGAWLYGWDNTDIKVNLDGTGGSVAENGTIGRWNDRSGYGNHVPQIITNRRPVYRDGRVACYYATNTTTRSGRLRSDATATAWATQNMSGGMIVDINGGNSSSPIVDFASGSLFAILTRLAPAQQCTAYFDGAAYQNTTLKFSARKCIITWRGNATNLILNVDGVEQLISPLASAAMSRLILGEFNGGGPFPVNFRELVMFASDVGATTIASLRSYFQSKAATASIDTTKTVCILGDSLSRGMGSELGKPWEEYVTNRATSKWHNWSVDGGFVKAGLVHMTAANMLTFKGSSEGVCVVWIGTNDIASAVATGTQTHTTLNTYCTALRAGGMKVIVCSLQDFTANRAEKTTFNGLVAANWTSYADGFVDLGAAPELDDNSDTTYFTSDGVHLMDAGYAVVGALIQTAMVALA